MTNIRPHLQRLRHRLREAQLATGALKGLLLAPVWLIRRRYLILEMDIMPIGDQTPALDWEQLSGEALEELLQANPNADPEEMRARERNGQVCYAWRVDGQVIHYRWYASGPTWLPFLDTTWHPEEGDYTVLSAFTHPGHRGRGIHTALVRQGLTRARELGLRRVVSFIAAWNRPSIRAVVQAGLRQSGSVTLWNLGVIRLHTRSGSARVSKGRLTIAPASLYESS